jgi:hypothetical protein
MQTDMSRLGFEPTIPVFESVKSFRALDRAAIVMGVIILICHNILYGCTLLICISGLGHNTRSYGGICTYIWIQNSDYKKKCKMKR